MAKKRTTATKRIGRKIQTKQFESLDISIECTDEIEWETLEERNKKLDQLTKLAINDFDETFGQVCKAVDVSEKRAFVHAPKPEAKSEEKPKSKSNSKKDDSDIDDFLGGLDGVGD